MRPINSIKKCNRPMNCNKNKLNGEKIRLFKPIPNTHNISPANSAMDNIV